MSYRKRLILIVLGVFVLYALLVLRYYKIQICEGDRWAAEAIGQHEFYVRDPFRRGTFFANTTLRKGDIDLQQPFAIDITKFHLCADPLAIPECHRDEVVQGILQFIEDGTYEELYRKLDKKSRYCKLYPLLDISIHDHLSAWWKGFAVQHRLPANALFFITDYQRSYPFGKLLGQVLHTLREVKDEKTGKAFPTGGLEAYFNHLLEGEVGERKLLRSPLNRLDMDRVIKMPKDGSDIYLTINPVIQTIAEEELERGVLEAKAQGGRLILMNSQTGEILALAQYPFFDPTNYKEYFNNKERIEHTKVSFVSDVFEPGSIMKPLTVAIALQANEEAERQLQQKIFDPKEPIDVTRTIFPGRKGSPLKDISRNSRLNMYMAIQKSSNVYVAQLADRIVQSLGVSWYQQKLLALGFGKKTGVELPSEASGLVPSPNRFHINGAPEWSLSTPYSLAMGYNVLATGVQMVQAYAILANGGYAVRPTLIKKIVSPSGEEQSFFPKERKRIFSEEITKEVVRAMRFTTVPGGSGFRAAPKHHSSAGKTGTTEKMIHGRYDKHRHIASFIGFTPVENFGQNCPPLVMLVSIDDPEYGVRADGTKNYMGGRCAAPVFSRVADRTLVYLGIPRDNKTRNYNQEATELRKLYEEWNRPSR
ncbi:Penicillin-binding protein 2,peptidoglycan synthase FtsI,Membrane carboxypeptidase/penicillin-binding protein,stage V sporulation protein D,Penicillin binding protein transpeptidase domain [Chlamydia serpentis]|uniref:Penicillin-binding protein 2,peptidoglycan synthase FtsI,Membrane carboxypeptidase/penicillin-binding protein,stage V sporulation protein D,Penicillin binding protein transpeptidase domain n=1 Tax=Chlamydia serpentis TaxID=1967782 RepID=A0A2R8FAX9_9CHLA|nr:penicillin-binding protein 2 [Chlamydia serpentis]SPN73554.1 Penicillin-binding protein 2,peptidoglycan synthase FtsI,Membrane carboxypeptidase/penicillin-binding protein,stage V sporulation protein D,Penicillin binding protein transpeptidase domain [Chlamydia serpentis]